MSRRWIVACACLPLAACGSDPRLGAPAEEELRGDVADVRAAARDGDRAGALSALDRLRKGIDQAEADGELDEREAAALRQGVRRAIRRVDRELAESPPPSTPDPTATAEPEKPKEEKPGKGHGDGDDEEGDD